ncbi:MAG TPA: tripartite tricarboxylate transporter substrate binding protein [Burkholderiales bacterium]|nr:tripartite tricarboxylate transporter substrate binding protein [Burkholderiales bacterium]
MYRLGVALVVLSIAPVAAQAQKAAASYPSRPIRIIVPFAPQGPNDILARLVGQKLTEAWGQQVVVDNRPGAGTVIGTELAARSPADGYTLLMVSTSTSVNPTLKKSLPYDTVRDFAPVIRLAETPNVLACHPSLPVTSVGELIRLAKTRPGQIAYASGGIGTSTHLTMEMLGVLGGLKLTHVPYKGAAPATVAVLSGEVSCVIASILPTMPYVKAKRLRALATTGERRAGPLPDVPTIGETVKGFAANAWFGIFAPAGTPPDIVAKLNAEIARILQTPAMRDQLALDGAEFVANTPEQFVAQFKNEIAKWGNVVKRAGVQEK